MGTKASEDDVEASAEAAASEVEVERRAEVEGGMVEFDRRRGATKAGRAGCCDSRNSVLGSKRRMMRGVVMLSMV